MSEKEISTKAELMAAIEREWAALNATLDGLGDSQLTTTQDAQGWTVKDHVAHLTRWERSVVFLLEGRPRHQGLGVEETLYLQGDEDEVNAAIQEQTREFSLGDAFAQFRETHQRLLALLEPLDDADLQKHYRDYLPDEPRAGLGPPIIALLDGNTAHHFAEHRRWIEALAAEQD